MSKATDKGSQGLSGNADLLQLTLSEDRHSGVVELRTETMSDHVAGGALCTPDPLCSLTRFPEEMTGTLGEMKSRIRWNPRTRSCTAASPSKETVS